MHCGIFHSDIRSKLMPYILRSPASDRSIPAPKSRVIPRCPFCKKHNVLWFSAFNGQGGFVVDDYRCLDCGHLFTRTTKIEVAK